jgi:hypothetical protein
MELLSTQFFIVKLSLVLGLIPLLPAFQDVRVVFFLQMCNFNSVRFFRETVSMGVESQAKTLKNLIRNIGSGLPTSPILGRKLSHQTSSGMQLASRLFTFCFILLYFCPLLFYKMIVVLTLVMKVLVAVAVWFEA